MKSILLLGAVCVMLSLVGGGCAKSPALAPLTVAPQCRQGGCGGELCCDRTSDGFCMSTCEYREEEACHAYRRTCRVQADGHCGWNPDELERDDQCVARSEYASAYAKSQEAIAIAKLVGIAALVGLGIGAVIIRILRRRKKK